MIYLLLIVHWFADFVCQSNYMAQNKSSSIKALSLHILVYTAILSVFGLKFAIINGLAHFAVDFITSRITKYLWKKQDVHNFFVVIGLDQLIHTITLIYTYNLLIG